MTKTYPDNISRRELIQSETATRLNIDNQPHSPEHEDNLLSVALFLQALRDGLSEKHSRDVPIIISSGYRSEALNTLIGGSKRSAHCYALAADFRASGLSTAQVVEFIHDNPSFDGMLDQVIDEHGLWVHIGLRQPKTEKKRWQFLRAAKQGARTVYTPYYPN